MYLVKEGRKDFLEFLRNLTPQVMIFSLVVISGVQLDFSTIDFSRTGLTIIFWILVLLFLTAFWANTSLFIDRAVESRPSVKRAFGLLSRKVRSFRLLRAKIVYAWRKNRIIFLEAVIIATIVEFSLVIVVLYGAKYAAGFISSGPG